MGGAAAKGAGEQLVGTLKSLEEEALRLFRGRLRELSGLAPIPEQRLREASAVELSEILLDRYGPDDALELTAELLSDIHCPGQAQGLRRGAAGSEYQEDPWGNDMCSLCHQEENPPENITPQVLCITQGSHQIYKLCSTGADTLHCCITKLRFEVKSTVSITYECESWQKHQQSLSAHQLIATGPLLNIHADPVEAVTAVYFPHFLYLADAYVSDSPEPHFVERHREQLIQRTTNVEGVLDMLYGNILNEEQYRRIFSKATNPEKMRELYSLMPGWNNSCKDSFYRALKLKNRFLIGDLEREATE